MYHLVHVRRVALGATLLLVATALAACSSSTEDVPTPTVTVAVTATVTATPEASGSVESTVVEPDDPITAEGAWLACYGWASGKYADSEWNVYPYTEGAASGGSTVTDNGDGSFEVLVPFAPSAESGGSGAELICDVSGTVGTPILTIQGARDFG